MKKGLILFFCLVLTSFCFPLFADSALVTYVRGKVEVQRQDGNWYPLSVGDTVEQSETISTGFYSDAKLEYNSSIMVLGALTRMTLEKLATSNDKEDVSLYLNVGAVRSKVNHTKEKRVAYVVKTSVAVASVRGTDFTITANGAITCHEGAVVVYPNVERFDIPVSSQEAEESEQEEETSEEDTTESGDYGPATPTTPAKEISEDAPAGAIVVGKDQTVSVTPDGTETPLVNATKKTQQAKTVVSTAASQEVEVVGSSAVTDNVNADSVSETVDTIILKNGSLILDVDLQP